MWGRRLAWCPPPLLVTGHHLPPFLTVVKGRLGGGGVEEGGVARRAFAMNEGTAIVP
jgi:hypothetical protein